MSKIKSEKVLYSIQTSYYRLRMVFSGNYSGGSTCLGAGRLVAGVYAGA